MSGRRFDDEGEGEATPESLYGASRGASSSRGAPSPAGAARPESSEDEFDEPEEAPRKASDVPLPGGDFRLFVTRLSFQAMMSLGLLENPVTGTKVVNRNNARMLIDDLEMLRDKTFGNLDDDESVYLDKVLSDLHHHMSRLG